MNSELFIQKNWLFDKDWSIDTAKLNAKTLKLEWNSQISTWTFATRSFFQSYEYSPNMRILVKHIKLTADAQISSAILQNTLTANPALVLSYLAGIPPPKQCF